jgi:hypothetical protein
VDTLLQVLERDPVRPRDLEPGIDRDLETVCLKCLEKEPRRRYDSAEALADDLERWLRGEPIFARPTGPVARLGKWARRRPAVAGLLTALAAVTVFGFGLVVWWWREAETQKQAVEAQERLTAGERDRADEQRRRAEGLLARTRRADYANRILLAARFLHDDRDDLARGHLAACDADLRGWEWDYLDRLATPTPLRRFPGHFQDVAFSPDGKWLAAAAPGGATDVWDLETGALRHHLVSGQEEKDGHVAFSPDGKYIATSGYFEWANISGGDLAVWDAATGKRLWHNEDEPRAIGFSADSALLAYYRDSDGVKVVEAATGRELRHIKEARSFAFGPGAG